MGGQSIKHLLTVHLRKVGGDKCLVPFGETLTKRDRYYWVLVRGGFGQVQGPDSEVSGGAR